MAKGQKMTKEEAEVNNAPQESQDLAAKEAEAKKQAEAAKEAAQKEQPKAKRVAVFPGIGRIVHYHRKSRDGMDGHLETFPAIVLGPTPSGSNLPADAVRLKIFTPHGDEARADVMFSEAGPKAGYWTWPVDALKTVK